MDVAGHTAIGALGALAASTWRTPESRPKLYALAICSSLFPDSDSVLYFTSFISFIVNHRVITHSLLALALMPWIGAATLRPYTGRRGYTTGVALSAACYGSHLVTDLIDPWGVVLFAPFSPARLSWGITVYNPDMLRNLLVTGAVTALIWTSRRRVLVYLMLALTGAYLAGAAGLKIEASHRFSRAVAAYRPTSMTVYPTESPLRWEGVADVDIGHVVGAVHIGSGDTITLQSLPAPPRDGLNQRADDLPEVRAYRWIFPRTVLLRETTATATTLRYLSDQTAYFHVPQHLTWDYGGVTIVFDARGAIVHRSFLDTVVTPDSLADIVPWVMGGAALVFPNGDVSTP